MNSASNETHNKTQPALGGGCSGTYSPLYSAHIQLAWFIQRINLDHANPVGAGVPAGTVGTAEVQDPETAGAVIQSDTMTKPFRGLCVACCLASLAALVMLLASDTTHRLRFTRTHQQAGALALILIGSSYICLQLSAKRPWTEMLKGTLLGLAFLLWGAEQLLPSSPLVTAMDTAVVTIFVVDLSLIIIEHLRRKDHETP